MKKYWDVVSFYLPHLYTVAMIMLVSAASEAFCERVFSDESFVHSERKNRLKHDKVEKIVKLRLNYEIVRKVSSPVTIDDEVEVVEM